MENTKNKSQGVGLYPPKAANDSPNLTPAIKSSPSSHILTPKLSDTKISPPPPKPVPNINSFTTYSRGQQSQSYILDRETIIALGGGSSPKSTPVVMSNGGGSGSGGGTINISQESGSTILNSFMKSILLTSLSST